LDKIIEDKEIIKKIEMNKATIKIEMIEIIKIIFKIKMVSKIEIKMVISKIKTIILKIIKMEEEIEKENLLMNVV